MIIKEFYGTRKDGINFYKSYSDAGLQIRKIGTNEIYDEAIDIENTSFEYEETNNRIIMPEENLSNSQDESLII